VALQIDPVEIVHSGAAKRFIGGWKASRFDKMNPNVKAGGEPHESARILWNVGLEKSKIHRAPQKLQKAV
jgi:hypothetical protein